MGSGIVTVESDRGLQQAPSIFKHCTRGKMGCRIINLLTTLFLLGFLRENILVAEDPVLCLLMYFIFWQQEIGRYI